MEIDSQEEKTDCAVEEIKKIPRSEWVIWVGAGVSFLSPSNLPLGDALTDFSLRQAFGEEVFLELEKIWPKAKNYLETNAKLKNISKKPRLESILNIVNEVEEKSRDLEFSFMNGFKGFKDAPFNRNHLCLASFLAQGATIITCNFDLCIENAYAVLQFGKDNLIKKNHGPVILYESERDPKVGKIWHYHGSVDEIAELGATLNQIKQGFTNYFERELTRILNNAKATIFVGYSFSDAFDAIPYFNNFTPHKIKNNKAYFFQFRLSKDLLTEDEKAKEARILNYLSCFNSKEYLYGDTAQFLFKLAPSISYKKESDEFVWEENFLNQTKFADMQLVRPFLICRLANALGIRVDFLSEGAFEKAHHFENYLPNSNEFFDTLAVASRRKGQHELERKYHSKKEKDEQTGDYLGYYYGLGNYAKAKDYAESLEEIREEARDHSKLLTWKPYTSMSVYCRHLVNTYLLNPFRYRVKEKHLRLINEYMEVLELLSGRELKNVSYINQFVTMLRFKMLFQALIDGKNNNEMQKLENRILYLYGEESSIEGFISIFRDISVKYIFLAKFHGVHQAYQEARNYAMHSYRIAQITGDAPGTKRAIQLFLAVIGNIPVSFLRNIFSRK